MPERPTPIDAALLDPFGVRRISASEELFEILQEEHSSNWDVDLMNQEKEAIIKFFGSLKPLGRERKQIISPPPEEITPERVHTWEKLGMVLHFLPEINLSQPDSWQKKWTGWVIKAPRFVNMELPGKWVLVDSQDRPSGENGQYLNSNDFLAPVIKGLRESKRLYYDPTYPIETRFMVSWHEYNNVLRFSIAEILGVSPFQIRLPRAIEFNYLGNIHYPEWGQADSWEWFQDESEEKRLCGGASFKGGLAAKAHDEPSIHRYFVWFRPLVEL